MEKDKKIKRIVRLEKFEQINKLLLICSFIVMLVVDLGNSFFPLHFDSFLIVPSILAISLFFAVKIITSTTLNRLYFTAKNNAYVGSVPSNCNLQKSFKRFGPIIRSKHRETDYFTAFYTYFGIFRDGIVRYVYIKADSSYTKEDYVRFRRQLTQSFTKMKQGHGRMASCVVIIFELSEPNEFIQGMINQPKDIHKLFWNSCIYDKNNSTLKFHKISLFDSMSMKKHFRKIFSYSFHTKNDENF